MLLWALALSLLEFVYFFHVLLCLRQGFVFGLGLGHLSQFVILPLINEVYFQPKKKKKNKICLEE